MVYQSRTKLWAVAAMIVILIVAVGLDNITKNLTISGSQSLDPRAVIWGFEVSNAIMALLLVALTWYMLRRVGHSLFVGWVFLVVGLLLTLYPPLLITTPLFRSISARLPIFSPASHLGFSGAVIAALGLFALFGRREQPLG